MIDIYFNNRVVHLTDTYKEYYAKYTNRHDLKELVYKFAKSEHEELYIYDEGLNNLFKNFKTCFNYIEAAGGLVVNDKDKILVIKTNGVWQLPKGKVEKGEKYDAAAIREVEEETGIIEPIIVKQLVSTYHSFKNKNGMFLKRTYWYKMFYKGSATPKPQKEENIEDARWVSHGDIYDIMKNTHKSLICIWEKA